MKLHKLDMMMMLLMMKFYCIAADMPHYNAKGVKYFMHNQHMLLTRDVMLMC